MTILSHSKIIEMAETYSYTLVGEYFNISRNKVAGIVFRHKNKGKLKARSPNSRGCNKLGTGHRCGRWKHKIF